MRTGVPNNPLGESIATQQVASPNSTENATINDFCSLKIIQPYHGKHV